MTPYTRRQLIVLLVLLLAAGLGFAVGHWRRAHPDLVERLEQFDVGPVPERPPARAAHPPETAGGRARRAGERTSPGSDARPRGPAARPRSAVDADPRPVDLNHAATDELVRLPGVGPALAARIIAVREARGPFDTVDDLRRVRGFGPAKIERLRPLVRLAD